MKGSRYWFAATSIWLCCFFNLERLNPGINVASFVYAYVAIWAATIILLPKLQRINQFGVFAMALFPYLVLKMWLGYGIVGVHLPTTVLEVGAIGLTIFLVDRISRGLESAQYAIANLTIGHMMEESTLFETGQEQLYQEIRRARYFERPAALLAIAVTPESLELSRDRFVQEAHQTICHQFASARIAQLLVDHLKDCDVITYRGDYFVTLLPETSNDDVGDIVRRLKAAADQELNLELKIGVSTFPDEAITFESLLERAERKMQSLSGQKGDSPDSQPATAAASEHNVADEPASYVGRLHTVSALRDLGG